MIIIRISFIYAIILLSACKNNELDYLKAQEEYYKGDYHEAHQIIDKSATKKTPDMVILKAKMVYEGKGTKSDPEAAINMLKPLAENNNSEAQNTLSKIFIKDKKWYDLHKGLTYAEKASNNGLPQASYDLGIIYAYGYAGKPDKVKAQKYLLLAASQGIGKANTVLGLMQKNNDKGKKCKLFSEAAEAGDTRGAYFYARCLATGLTGDPNFNEAAYWYKYSAEKGYPSAQSNLGYFYEKGLGVKKNRTMAIYWYCRAKNAVPSAYYRISQWHASCP